VAELGSALALLVVTLQACGDGGECLLNLRDLERTLGKAHITLKSWANRLVELGYITKESAGPSGLRIRLVIEKLPRLSMGLGPNLPVQQAQDVLRAVRTTMDNVLANGIACLGASAADRQSGGVAA
jgi:hypothetical protein